MEWHRVCATCGKVVESFRHMHKLHSTYVCNQCAFENTAALDDYIQISFTISSSVRDISFHHLEEGQTLRVNGKIQAAIRDSDGNTIELYSE